MIITVASLTLRFYKVDGWTEDKVRKLLVNPKTVISYRNDSYQKNKILGDLTYYAVYENSGYKVFKKSEMDKHTFNDNQKFKGINWYINEEI